MQSTETDLIRKDIGAYLASYQQKELLRFVAVGSVDDGKSTLIGRLLHDTGMVYEDQLAAVKRATQMEGEEIDFSLFTDGLKAEREQGITIDVAYRYFATERRKFIIADTPGHVQYTRNMVTGASTADVAIILVDARLGVLQQTKRHAYIAALLGIPHFTICVNKMDLVGYDRGVYDRIRAQLSEFTKDLGFQSVTFIPISALKGSNVVSKSEHTPWYEGNTVLEHLETVPVGLTYEQTHFRLPVQTVIRPNLDYRGFAGQIAGGVLRQGDEVMVLPSGKRSRVKSIDTFDAHLDEAFAPQSVCVRLEHEIDCSRGDMLVHPSDLPMVERHVDAHLVWMSETPLDPQKTYLLKHTTQSVRVQIDHVRWKKDLDTLAEVSAASLELNEIGRVAMSTHRALFFDPYTENRQTGAFIVVDSLTNDTVAAGMIIGPTDGAEKQDLDAALKELRAGSGLTPKTQVSPRERFERMGQKGAVVWLVGPRAPPLRPRPHRDRRRSDRRRPALDAQRREGRRGRRPRHRLRVPDVPTRRPQGPARARRQRTARGGLREHRREALPRATPRRRPRRLRSAAAPGRHGRARSDAVGRGGGGHPRPARPARSVRALKRSLGLRSSGRGIASQPAPMLGCLPCDGSGSPRLRSSKPSWISALRRPLVFRSSPGLVGCFRITLTAWRAARTT
jgi:bifunctional enzyme CysN/CysC